MTLGITGIIAVAFGFFMFGFLIAAVMASGKSADLDASEQ